ncbi:MAG TPA: ribonuclease III [Bacteriovoracaceae bacterium]|nr:ribonuclease III [Bacteriovoracaceae bacterium]
MPDQPRIRELVLSLYETKSLAELENLLGHDEFHSFQELHRLEIPVKALVQAFTHTSFTHEYNSPHQELLEFLGDSVLQLILTDELFRRFPQANEGHLSKLRSSIVNEKSLSVLATALKLGDLVLVGRGEFKKKLFNHEAVLADTLEALLGQIYKYHGFDFTRSLFLGWLTEFLPDAFEEGALKDFDFKSRLQEAVLAKYKKLPRYTSENRGEQFEISLWVNEELRARGVFASKRSGEKDLAEQVYKKGTI